ncbi:olfactory receptor 11A1-like [Halichoeres trimaculatus]|uniref:olfactory receptor 11A1-like n=1 Tax=Halichoeres trimaculatus TaxID=147232 RepID=UPI003D9EEC5A
MMNSTVYHFVLSTYVDVGNLKYLFFSLTALLYLTIIVLNMFLVAVICVHRSLHEPMYVFLCSLFVSEVYGSTGLFPLLLVQLLSDVHTVSVSFCFLQIFCLFTYAQAEFCNLAIMSYDRYLAICHPLQYNTLMTFNKAVICVCVIWVFSLTKFLISLSLSVTLPLCGNVIHSLYCHNYLVVKLACSDTKVNNIYGVFGTILTVMVSLLPIVYSYCKILQVCFSGSTQTRRKAVSTCAPHLASLINFSFGCMFEILQARFDTASMPSMLRIIMSLYFLLIQPALNPIMYGLQLSKIRKICKHVLCPGVLSKDKETL